MVGDFRLFLDHGAPGGFFRSVFAFPAFLLGAPHRTGRVPAGKMGPVHTVVGGNKG